MTTSTEELLSQLKIDPDYLILDLFKATSLYKKIPANVPYFKWIFLDTEGTGIDKLEDKAVELGMVSVAVSHEGQLLGILDTLTEMEDPKMPMSVDAYRVHRIEEVEYKDKNFDDTKIEDFIKGADLVIAHNAEFDRAFVEKRFTFFKDYNWACSLKEIPWQEAGISSGKLEFIAFKQGFFYSAHRAYQDCMALIYALTKPLRDDLTDTELGTGLELILKKSKEFKYRVWAVMAPFEAKTILRKRNYRWSDGSEPNSEKAWYIDIPEDKLESELAWLKEEIYKRSTRVVVDEVTSKDKYTNRSSSRSSTLLK